MGLKDIFMNTLIIGIFVFAIIAGGISLADINNANQTIANDPIINSSFASLQTELQNSESDVNSSFQTYAQSEVTVGGESLQLTSVTRIARNILVIPKTIYSLTLGIIFNKIFGGASFAIVFTIILAMLVALIIFYGWKWIRTGDPD